MIDYLASWVMVASGSHKTTNLHDLPYDILYQIISHLDYVDYINLSRTNKALHSQLETDSLAKRSIENSKRETKEAQLAFAGRITFREAIGRIYDRKQAVASASPYGVAVLAYATTFLYQEGVLSYYCANQIRILNVHQAAHTEQVLDVRKVFRRIIPDFDQQEQQDASVELCFLNYSAGLLAILVDIGATSSWLVLLDVTPQGPASKTGRLRFRRQLHCTRHLFVRHNDSHLFYGVYTSPHPLTNPQWAVQCVDLTITHDDAVVPDPILLDQFHGTDIGQNVCFEIIDNHLYAVTSSLRPSHERDYTATSFYGWVCIAPTSKIRRARTQEIFRRKHTEGPLFDTWSEISLRRDEVTGRPMIAESRREWQSNRTDNVRTYYTLPLMYPSELPPEITEDKYATTTREADLSSTLPDSPLISPASPDYPLITGGVGPSDITFARSASASADPEVNRPPKYLHTEYPSSDTPKRDFILNRTKLQAYNPSAAAFVDLVNDIDPKRGENRFRVRACSRKRKRYSRDEAIAQALRSCKKPRHDRTLDEDESEYVYSGVYLWPAENSDQDLAQLLCPAKTAPNVLGVADERTIVYSVDITDDTPPVRAIILINFDPQIRLPCMRSRKQTSGDSCVASMDIDVDKDLPCVRDIINAQDSSVESSQSIPSRSRSVRTKHAMHLSINRGYWFDRKQICTEYVGP